MHRRDVLGLSAGAAVMALAGTARAAAVEDGPKRLVVIMLRGAVDGLNVVVPCADDAYYAARPNIAIGRPGTANGALRLDDRFGLHPALAALTPLWQAGQLAFVHAAGSPDPTRSHFEAQLYVENGTPGRTTTSDGWLNRLLAALPGPHHPAEALSVGAVLPRILRGRMAAANLPLGPQAARSLPIDKPPIARLFGALYAGPGRQAQAYREGQAAREELIGEVSGEEQAANNGAPPPRSFPGQAAQLAGLIAADQRIRLAFASLGGWDTHVNQGNAQGQLANHLKPLGDGLAALAQELGRAWDDTVVVVLSEFGRTVHENGNGGTDHGHGNVVWLMGGSVKGGQVYGEWPGLAPGQLYQDRDLAVTTDFRRVLAAVLERHLRLADERLDTIFPGMPAHRPSLPVIR